MKTNQLILATAVALMAITACEKPKFVEENNGEVAFYALNQKATKANDAIITGATYAHDNTFQVWGWQSQIGDYSEFSTDAASNFMSNLTISWTGGRDSKAEAWRNADHYYYWPYTGRIAFLAIHPSTVAPSSTGWDATNTKPQATINDYTISSTNKTTDLMFANNESARRTDELGMVFKHALSQIEVKVKTDEDYSADVAFDVESVTFHNIDLSGDVLYQNDAFTWSDNAAQTESWTYYDTVLEDITDSYQVYGAANVMIPQPANIKADELDPSDAAYDADDHTQTTITIGYSMEQTNCAKITGEVTVALPMLWEAGKKYNYTINFRLNEILFDPTVENWVDVDVTPIVIY